MAAADGIRRGAGPLRRPLPQLIIHAGGRLGDLRDQQNLRIATYQNTSINDPQFHDLASQPEPTQHPSSHGCEELNLKDELRLVKPG